MTDTSREIIYGDEFIRRISQNLNISLDNLGGFLVLAAELNEDHSGYRLVTASNIDDEWAQIMLIRQYLKQIGIPTDIFTPEGVITNEEAMGTTPDCGPHCPDAEGDARGESHCNCKQCHGKD